jgi:cyclohexyl-isocyanide hydratase
MAQTDATLKIGSLLFERLDQIDLTGPFEVFSRVPNATCRIFAKSKETVRDARGLRLTPDALLDEAPQLDLLHIPGGAGQEAVMNDDEVLAWIRRQAEGARCVFSVCTGSLILGAAGLLKGKRATTYWTVFDLLPLFGAIPVDERVVEDGKLVTAAGVTSGIDGALRVVADLRGDEVAEVIQLSMQYAPEPPFDSGSPKTAPPAVVETARAAVASLTAQRERTARRIAERLGINAGVSTVADKP